MAIICYQFSVVKDLPSVTKLEKAEMTVREILDYLENECQSELKRKILTDSGELKEDYVVSVNGTHVRFLNGLDSSVKTGDEVAIAFLIAGG